MIWKEQVKESSHIITLNLQETCSPADLEHIKKLRSLAAVFRAAYFGPEK